MKKIRVLLALQILSLIMFVGGCIFVVPRVYMDGVPLFIKIFVSVVLFTIGVCMFDNALDLCRAYRRIKKEDKP